MTPNASTFVANARTYSPSARPVVVVCLDGSADEYLDAAMARGKMPNLQKMAVRGYRGFARGALPSFTNVNNASIITGVPPSIHGISGNFFLDPQTGEEVMMNSAKYLRAETITAAAARAGRKVGIVTAKEKLRDILGHGLFDSLNTLGAQDSTRGIAFSSEKAPEAREKTHGISDVERVVGRRTPEIYSGDASLFVFYAGVALIESQRADFLYLSTTDYIQHKHKPEDPAALEFYAEIDTQLGRMLELGAILGITADHGMNAKCKPDGSPNVIYLETLLRETFQLEFKVILPITDPYVLHHGALGSFAVVHGPSTAPFEKIAKWLLDLPGITEVHDRATAAAKLELPADRIGDLIVLSGRDTVIGRTPAHHDLKAVASGLRSHGGRYEEMVPFIISEPLNDAYAVRAASDPRNFDIFDFACNGTVR